MKIFCKDIINRIDSGFSSIYKPFAHFPHSGDVWNECINAVSDEKLMNNIVFCNDILALPPVKVFLAANKTLNRDLSDYEKKAIGAFWGFVFKFILGYKYQKSISVRVNTVKSATYFLDCPQPIEVVRSDD